MKTNFHVGLMPLALVAGGGLFVAACDSSPPSPPKPPSKAQNTVGRMTGGNLNPPAAPAEPAPATARPTVESEEEPDIAYAYSPIGKRDPFRSLFEQLQIEEREQQLTQLQRFELDQLKLVAIVSRIATPHAMVEDPKGKGYSITRGTLIGKNWGRVSAITPDCVTVKEEYRDYTGRKVTNTTDKCLPKPEELKVD